MGNYLLDTDVLIDFFKGRTEAASTLRQLAEKGHALGICCVNLAEFYAGLSQIQREKADLLFERLAYFEIAAPAAKLAGEFRYRFARKGVALSTADTLVAATAVQNDAHLVTRNASHFPMQEIRMLELSRPA